MSTLRTIARSQPSECVALYCSQLLDLAVGDNVLSTAAPAAGSASRLAAGGGRRARQG